MELLFAIVSVSLRLLATAWSVVVVWRTGDWKLVFLPLMLALTAAQPLLPHFPTEQWSAFLVVILNAMAVLVFYILVRWSQFGSKNKVLGSCSCWWPGINSLLFSSEKPCRASWDLNCR